MPTGNRIPLKRFSFISLPLLQYHRPSFLFFSFSLILTYSTVSFLFSFFFFSFSTTSGHPLKISMQYLSELDVGFIINVKYSCYFKNVGRPPLCFSGFKVCLRCVPSAQGQFIHTGCSNLLKPTMLICENTSIRVV